MAVSGDTVLVDVVPGPAEVTARWCPPTPTPTPVAAGVIGELNISGGSLTLGNLTFQDLVGWDWYNANNGTYDLIDGCFSVAWGNTAYLSEATAYDFGNGKKGYFTAGSLNAVIIPEPSVALSRGFGLFALLRRRR